MSDVRTLRTLAEIEEAAAAWIWRLDDDEVSARTREEFGAWLQRDPRHAKAFEELGGVWHALDQLAEAKREEKIATFVAEEQRLVGRVPGGRHWIAAAPWAVAATVVVAFGILLFRGGPEVQTLATAVGQQRSIELADGSSVQLNTNTILETRYDEERRAVFLSKGEAAFKVAHDAGRPFLVHAGGLVVRAVGTEFNVRLNHSRGVEVIVTEGKVVVEPEELEAPPREEDAAMAGAPPRRELVAGQLFETVAATPVIEIDAVALSNALAWQEGAIVFDGEPLASAVAELNRYTDARLVVADASLADLRVGGRFRVGDVDGFVDAMVEAFPVSTRRGDDGLIYLYASEQ